MKLETPQIVRRHEQESPFLCSACGADRGCDCNAPAVERLAAKVEQDRKRAKAYRERKASRDADVENIEQSGNDMDPEQSAAERRAYYEATEDAEPGDDDQTVWRRGVMFRARAARVGAEFENWSRFKIDRQVVDEARAAADAWMKLARYLEELQGGYKKGAA